MSALIERQHQEVAQRAEKNIPINRQLREILHFLQDAEPSPWSTNHIITAIREGNLATLKGRVEKSLRICIALSDFARSKQYPGSPDSSRSRLVARVNETVDSLVVKAGELLAQINFTSLLIQPDRTYAVSPKRMTALEKAGKIGKTALAYSGLLLPVGAAVLAPEIVLGAEEQEISLEQQLQDLIEQVSNDLGSVTSFFDNLKAALDQLEAEYEPVEQEEDNPKEPKILNKKLVGYFNLITGYYEDLEGNVNSDFGLGDWSNYNIDRVRSKETPHLLEVYATTKVEPRPDLSTPPVDVKSGQPLQSYPKVHGHQSIPRQDTETGDTLTSKTRESADKVLEALGLKNRDTKADEEVPPRQDEDERPTPAAIAGVDTVESRMDQEANTLLVGEMAQSMELVDGAEQLLENAAFPRLIASAYYDALNVTMNQDTGWLQEVSAIGLEPGMTIEQILSVVQQMKASGQELPGIPYRYIVEGTGQANVISEGRIDPNLPVLLMPLTEAETHQGWVNIASFNPDGSVGTAYGIKIDARGQLTIAFFNTNQDGNSFTKGFAMSTNVVRKAVREAPFDISNLSSEDINEVKKILQLIGLSQGGDGNWIGSIFDMN